MTGSLTSVSFLSVIYVVWFWWFWCIVFFFFLMILLDKCRSFASTELGEKFCGALTGYSDQHIGPNRGGFMSYVYLVTCTSSELNESIARTVFQGRFLGHGIEQKAFHVMQLLGQLLLPCETEASSENLCVINISQSEDILLILVYLQSWKKSTNESLNQTEYFHLLNILLKIFKY